MTDTERMLSDEPETTKLAPPPAARSFTIGQVLTVACANTEAHQMFCSYAELVDVLGFLLNDVPMADELADAIEQCRPHVVLAYPDFGHVHPPALDASDTAVLAWIAAQEREHGAELALRPIEASA